MVVSTEQETEPPTRPRNVPRHVAVIMDGNGRWAKKRMLPRQAGHVSGIVALRRVVMAAHQLGISYFTVYGFSTENWQRPQSEVSSLMGLFRRFFRADMTKLQNENVRVRFIGGRADLAPDIAELIEEGERMTARNTGLNLTIAFNYGAREELVACARALAREAQSGQLEPDKINAANFSSHLQTAGFPDVDLVIRPGGEKRISNFLLWQAAYAEFVFTETLWPDFSEEDLRDAVAEYGRRDRRFGGIRIEQGTPDDANPASAGRRTALS